MGKKPQVLAHLPGQEDSLHFQADEEGGFVFYIGNTHQLLNHAQALEVATPGRLPTGD